jgi:ligand-binding sensor domain-containing protein
LWVLTDFGISLYSKKTQKFKNYINNKESFLYNLKPTSISTDKDGNILIGYEDLIIDYIYITEDPSDIVNYNINYKRLFLRKDNNKDNKKDYITQIYQSSDKKYWIGTHGIGFFSIDYKELQNALKNNTNEIKLNHYN